MKHHNVYQLFPFKVSIRLLLLELDHSALFPNLVVRKRLNVFLPRLEPPRRLWGCRRPRAW
jgi:hypothetical protein